MEDLERVDLSKLNTDAMVISSVTDIESELEQKYDITK